MSRRLVDTIRVRRKRSQLLVESVSIESIFPPYSSDTEGESSSESNELCPRFSCSIDEIFPPARSPSQSPPRLSVSIETFFHPTRSPSQSDSSGNYEEIFPTDPFISTSSRCTFGGPRTVVTQVTFNNARTQILQISICLQCYKCRKKAMKIVFGLSGVQSASIKGQKNLIEVQGKGIDAANLVGLLRKKVARHATMLSVREEKKEEKEDEKIDELNMSMTRLLAP